MSSAPRPDGRPGTSTTGTILRVLTNTQNASALVFGTFLTIHLAAPLAAAVGGLGAADGVMVLGREVYLPLEPVLVYTPLGLHLASAILRRGLLVYRTGRIPTLSTHSMLGYALIPLVIPHLLLHRLIPADPNPIISSLSPSEFGYEFVAHAVATRPWMTVGYLVLTGVGLWHSCVGGMKVVGWLRQSFGKAKPKSASTITTNLEGSVVRTVPKTRKIGLRGIVAALVGIVGIGLYRLCTEASGVSTLVNKRFDAVFAAAPWAAIGLK